MVGPLSPKAFLEGVAYRRTVYALSNTSPIPKSEIVDIVQKAVKHTPSSYNTQTTRAVVLFGDDHTTAWDTAAELILPFFAKDEKLLAMFKDKFAGFRGAYGSVMFLEDQETIEAAEKARPMSAKFSQEFSLTSNGMAQHTVWTALELAGLRANLQHATSLNPSLMPTLAERFGVPKTWRCYAWLNFGEPKTADLDDKTFQPIEDRVLVVGA